MAYLIGEALLDRIFPGWSRKTREELLRAIGGEEAVKAPEAKWVQKRLRNRFLVILAILTVVSGGVVLLPVGGMVAVLYLMGWWKARRDRRR